MDDKSDSAICQLTGGGDMGGVCGNLFQVKLLMLFLQRGMSFSDKFELATEIKDAKKFDDLVFKHKEETEDEFVIRYCILQAKHKMDPTQKIKITDLLTAEDSPFGLVKYFYSYTEAKRGNLFREAIIDHAVVYTNANLDLYGTVHSKDERLKDLCIKDFMDDVPPGEGIMSICKIDGRGKIFILKNVESFVKIIKPMILEYKYKRLAKVLVRSLQKGKELSRRDPFLSNYHILLGQEVIDLKNRQFKDEFVNEICVDFETATGRQKLKAAMKELDKDGDFDAILKSDKEFKLGRGFGMASNKNVVHKWLRGDIRVFDEKLEDPRHLCDLNLKTVASKLIECLVENKAIDKMHRAFERFYKVVFRDVLDLKNKEFYDSFINLNKENLTKEQKGLDKFREKVIEELERKHLVLSKVNEYLKSGKMSIVLCDAFWDNFDDTKQFWENENGVDDDIKDFIITFRLAVGQPSEREFDELIKTHLKVKYPNYNSDLMYSYFFKEMLDWMKGDESEIIEAKKSFISYNAAKEFIEKIATKFHTVTLKGPTIDYDKNIKEYRISFDSPQLESTLGAFLTSTKKTMIVSGESVTISSMRFYHELKKLKTDPDIMEKDVIFVRISSLLKPSLEFIIEDFRKSDSVNSLLVVEFDLDQSEVDDHRNAIYEIAQKIFYIIRNNKDKKFILIEKQNDILSNYFREKMSTDEIEETFEKGFDFSKLSDVSQYILLESKVNFQGYEVELGDVITRDSRYMINCEILSMVMKGDKIKIFENFKQSEKVPSYYIDRKFIRVLRTSKHVYLISGVTESDLCFPKDKSIALDELIESDMTAEESETYESFREGDESKNVFLLRTRNDSLLLLKGPPKTVLPAKELKEMLTSRSKDDVVLMSAVAGMGKSTTFTNLAIKAKEQSHTRLVIKVDLNSVSRKLSEIMAKGESVTRDDVLEFLSYGLRAETEVEKIFLLCCLQRGKTVIFFDGFDEISPNYEKVVIGIIKTIQAEFKTELICMSTRPYKFILNNIQSSFDSNFYIFQGFSEKNQEEFLRKYWRDPSRLDYNEHFFKWFLGNVSGIMSENLNDYHSMRLHYDNVKITFLGIALHTEMIAKLLRGTFEKYIQHFSDLTPTIYEGMRSELKKSLQLSTLYQNFIHIKFHEVCFGAKMNLDLKRNIARENADEVFVKFGKKCRLLALNALFDEKFIGPILTEKQLERLNQYKNDIKVKGERIGIVNQIVDEKPLFIHRTFAEFFAADFFISCFQKIDAKSEEILELLLKHILNEKNDLICEFFDSKLSDRIIENLKSCRCQYLTKNSDSKFLELAVSRRWRKLVKFLIDHTNISGKENLFVKLAVQFENCEYGDNSGDNMLNIVLGKIKSNPEVVKNALEDEFSSGFVINDGSNFCKAVQCGKLDNIKAIAKICKEVNILDSMLMYENLRRENLIHFAAQNSCDEVLQFLIGLMKLDRENLKKMLLKSNSDCETPLLILVRRKSFDNVRFFTEVYQELNIFKIAIIDVNNPSKNLINSAVQNQDLAVLKYFWNLLENDKESLKEMLLSPSAIGTPLTQCASCGHIDNLKFITEKYREFQILQHALKIKNFTGHNIMHFACRQFEIFKHLQEQLKEDPETLKCLLLEFDGYGETPLMISANMRSFDHRFTTIVQAYQDLEILETELTNESLNKKNLMHLAVNDWNLGVVKYLFNLLKPNPQILQELLSRSDENGDTPLIIAARTGKLDMLQEIISVLQEIKILEKSLLHENLKGENIMHFAVQNNRPAFIKYLLELLKNSPDILKSTFQKPNLEGVTPMMMAARDGYLNNIKQIFQFCRNFFILEMLFDVVNSKGQNIVCFVVRNPHLDTVQHFLEELKWRSEFFRQMLLKLDQKNRTPLMYAASYGTVENMKLIIKCYKESETFESRFSNLSLEGKNLLHFAANNSNSDVISYLLDQIKDQKDKYNDMILKKDQYGLTPLMIAAGLGHAENVQALIEACTDDLNILETLLGFEDSKGTNLIHFGSSYYNSGKVMKYLAIQLDKNSELLKRMLLKSDHQGCIPFMSAAQYGHVDNVRILTELCEKFGILKDVLKHESHEGRNVIFFAVQNTSANSLKYLLNLLKVDLDVLKEMISKKDQNGCTAFDIAQSINLQVLVNCAKSLNLL